MILKFIKRPYHNSPLGHLMNNMLRCSAIIHENKKFLSKNHALLMQNSIKVRLHKKVSEGILSI